MTNDIRFIDDISPDVEIFDPQWSDQTLAAILADAPDEAPRRRTRPALLFAVPVAVAAAVGLALAPSLISTSSDGPGASAAAAAVLTRGAASLEAQTPGPDEYLHVEVMQKVWVDGTFKPSERGWEDWVPGDRTLPMIEQTREGGKVTDTGAHPMTGPDADFHANYPSNPRDLLDVLNERAIAQDSDEGDWGKNVWDQAFRELQAAEVPMRLKAEILTALAQLPGVDAKPSSISSGQAERIALTFENEPLAFVFDKTSGAFWGMTLGIDHPADYDGEVQWTWEFVTAIVPTAPTPDRAGE